MRGDRERQATIMLAVTPEAFVPDDHPRRRIKPLVDDRLARLWPRFEEMYAQRGRPSIPPEHLLKGSLLIALFSVRSERQFCEQLRYNLLFKWFLDLNVEDEPFNATTFSKNRERLLEAEVARAFFAEVVAEAGRWRLLSDDHFSVDGTLLEAWTSLKATVRGTEEPPSRPGGRRAQHGGGLPRALRAQPRDARLGHLRSAGDVETQVSVERSTGALLTRHRQRNPHCECGGRWTQPQALATGVRRLQFQAGYLGPAR